MNQESIHILIVEDEPLIAKEIAYNLQDNGYEVAGIAHSYEKALILLNNKKIDIALLDIAINGSKNGIELAQLINKKYKIPFVFLTSFADQDTIDQVSQTRPQGYLVKPFKDRDLKPAIEIAMLNHRSKTEKAPTRNRINKYLKEDITESEYRVIEQIWDGKTNSEVASELYISINTVKKHTNSIYRKTQMDRKPNLIKFLQLVKLDRVSS